MPKLGGIPQLLRSFAAYKKLIEIYPSASNAIEFCQGTFSEMQGEDIYEMIRYFGQLGKILYVHFSCCVEYLVHYQEIQWQQSGDVHHLWKNF